MQMTVAAALPALLAAALLAPASDAWAQGSYGLPSTLSVVLQEGNPFVYRDAGGHSVAVGTVENNSAAPVTGFRIQAKFYDQAGQAPLETVTGGTVLEVVPPGGSSPYVIRSESADPGIDWASASLLGFAPSSAKEDSMSVTLDDVYSDSELHVRGTLDAGAAAAPGARVHLAVHDAFDPPRMLGVETVELGDLGPGGSAGFEFDLAVDPRAVGLVVHAESDASYSGPVRDDVPPVEYVRLQEGNPFVYRDAGGRSVVVGLVENNDAVPVEGVEVRAGYYTLTGQTPVETVTGGTILEVIPPGGSSPYVIRSGSADPGIAWASASLLGFAPSSGRAGSMSITLDDVYSDSELHVRGTLDAGAAAAPGARVHLAVHDSADPPRMLGVETVELGDLGPGESAGFELDWAADARTAGLVAYAESDASHAAPVAADVPPPQVASKVVTITGVALHDPEGGRVSVVEAGQTVNIRSETRIEFAADPGTGETAYTYYVQVKESGRDPAVVYIGHYDGRFEGTGTDSQVVDWIPERPGLYFLESFVWDRDGVPIAEKGPIVLFAVT